MNIYALYRSGHQGIWKLIEANSPESAIKNVEDLILSQAEDRKYPSDVVFTLYDTAYDSELVARAAFGKMLASFTVQALKKGNVTYYKGTGQPK